MNRPPKKKKQAADRLSEDPRFSPEELERVAANKTAEGDDRNLVEIDDAFSEADIEDRVWLYWQRNKNFVIGATVVAILGVVGINTWRILQEKQLTALQTDYSAAIGEPAKLQAFGDAHADDVLGGLALLDAADAQYADGNFDEAATLYARSLPALKDTVLSGRGRLGMGIAKIKAGQTAAGQSDLSTLFADSATLEAVRAEAAYTLAQLALAEGKRDEAKQWLQQTIDLPGASVWKSQAELLLRGEKLGENS